MYFVMVLGTVGWQVNNQHVEFIVRTARARASGAANLLQVRRTLTVNFFIFHIPPFDTERILHNLMDGNGDVLKCVFFGAKC